MCDLIYQSLLVLDKVFRSNRQFYLAADTIAAGQKTLTLKLVSIVSPFILANSFK